MVSTPVMQQVEDSLVEVERTDQVHPGHQLVGGDDVERVVPVGVDAEDDPERDQACEIGQEDEP